jgi:hypothetical protein
METTIKQVCAVAAGLVLCAVAAQASIIDTYNGTATSLQAIPYQECLNQWFTVPAGTEGTHFQFYADWSGYTGSATNSVLVAIYPAVGEVIKVDYAEVGWYGTTHSWVDVNLGSSQHLAPGSYYAQMWSNQENLQSYLSAVKVDPSTYSGGYASWGWGGGTTHPYSGADFWANLTVESVPEPATGLILLGGLGVLLHRRRSVKR